jgi:hypothetical protein
MSDPMRLSNFDATQQVLGTLVAYQTNNNHVKNDARGISTIETFKKSNKLKKGKEGKETGGKRLEDRFYQKDDWNRLTQDQHNKVTEMARERKKRAGDSAYSKCKMATAESSDRDDNENTDAKSSPGENGGNKFGRSAHKKNDRAQQSSWLESEELDPAEQSVKGISCVGYQQYVMEAKMKVINSEGRLELDTHADTWVAGANTVVLDLTGKHVSVTPFCEDEYEPITEIPIASVATAYDCPDTGRVWVLIINKALYFGSKMANTLLCSNQLWQHDIVIEDCPRQFDWSSSHSIFIPSRDIRFPLTLNGIISGLVTRQPKDEELEDFSLHIEMTSSEEWDPYSIDYALAEENYRMIIPKWDHGI